MLNCECPLCGAITSESYCSCDSEPTGKYIVVWRNWECAGKCCIRLFDTATDAAFFAIEREHPAGGHVDPEWKVALIREEDMAGIELDGDDRGDIVDERLKKSLKRIAATDTGWFLDDNSPLSGAFDVL